MDREDNKIDKIERFRKLKYEGFPVTSTVKLTMHILL